MHFKKKITNTFRRKTKNNKTRKNERKQKQRQNAGRCSPTNRSMSSACSSSSSIRSQASNETLIRPYSREVTSSSREFFRMAESPTPRNFPIQGPSVKSYPIRVGSQATFRVETPAPIVYPIHRSPSPSSIFDSIRPRRSFSGKRLANI